jgi:hypothetical protein
VLREQREDVFDQTALAADPWKERFCHCVNQSDSL